MTNKEALMLLTRATAQIDVLSKMAVEAAQLMMQATSALYVNSAMNGEPLPDLTGQEEH